MWDSNTQTDINSPTNLSPLEQKLLVTTASSENSKMMGKGKDKVDENGDVKNRKSSTFKRMARLTGSRTKSPTRAPFAPIENFEINEGPLPMKCAMEQTLIDVDDLVKRSKTSDSDSTLVPVMVVVNQNHQGQ